MTLCRFQESWECGPLSCIATALWVKFSKRNNNTKKQWLFAKRTLALAGAMTLRFWGEPLVKFDADE